MNQSQVLRADLLAALAELGSQRPEWRFGQLLANVAMAAGHLDAGAVWNLEDAEALEAARNLLQQYTSAEDEVHATHRSD